jgi:hypothetical protein
MPEMEKMKYVATKIDSETLSEVERITRETGLKTADLLRVGLRKLIKEYAEVGKIEVGKEADGQNSQRRQAAGRGVDLRGLLSGFESGKDFSTGAGACLADFIRGLSPPPFDMRVPECRKPPSGSGCVDLDRFSS